MGIAYLSSPHGQKIQERAYSEIMAIYPNGDAWEQCLTEEHVPYVTAFVKEVLRFWTVIPICLPRVSIKPIRWEDATIPAGTTFYMVRAGLCTSLQKNMLTLFVPERLLGRLRPGPLFRPLYLRSRSLPCRCSRHRHTSLCLWGRFTYVRGLPSS